MVRSGLVWVLGAALAVAGCGVLQTEDDDSPNDGKSRAKKCEQRGDSWVWKNGRCTTNSQKQCAENEKRVWLDGQCLKKTSLTDKQWCELKGSRYGWEDGQCVKKKKAVSFEDPNLEQCVKQSTVRYKEDGKEKQGLADLDQDGVVRVDEAARVKKLSCSGKNLTSLKGVSKLENLEYLNCAGNELGVLPDLSGMKKLNTLICNNNYFTAADCGRIQKLKDRNLERLDIVEQRDGRKVTCDQIKMIDHIGPTKDKNGQRANLNDVWGFTHAGTDYAVYGDNMNIYIVEVTSQGFGKRITLSRGKKGNRLFTDPNDSTWGEYRYYTTGEETEDPSDDKAWLFASSEGHKAKVHKSKKARKNHEPPKLQLFDLTNLQNGEVKEVKIKNLHPGLRSIHNITLDASRDMLIAFGGTQHDAEPNKKGEKPAWKGARFYDVRQPDRPKYLGTVGDLYVHDGQIKTQRYQNGEKAGEIAASRLYVAHGSGKIHWDANRTTNKKNRFRAYDVSSIDVDAPVDAAEKRLDVPTLIDQQYPSGYCHNIWVTEDNQFAVVTGETSVDDQLSFWRLNYPEGVDVDPLDGEVPADDPADKAGDATFVNGLNLQGGSFAHNAFIVGNTIYVSHYSKGVQVARIVDDGSRIVDGERVDSRRMKLVWAYDSYPKSNAADFVGSWGVYPFSQNKEIFFATDITNGFFLFRKTASFLNGEQ